MRGFVKVGLALVTVVGALGSGVQAQQQLSAADIDTVKKEVTAHLDKYYRVFTEQKPDQLASEATHDRGPANRHDAGKGLPVDDDISGVQGAAVADLGQTQESELSPAIRERITGVEVGRASPVLASGDQVSTIVVCAREAGGGGVPDRQQIEDRLREQELAMLSERYLRNLRREATIITRSQ